MKVVYFRFDDESILRRRFNLKYSYVCDIQAEARANAKVFRGKQA